MFNIYAFCCLLTWFVSIIQNVKLHNVNAFKTNGKGLLSYIALLVTTWVSFNSACRCQSELTA